MPNWLKILAILLLVAVAVYLFLRKRRASRTKRDAVAPVAPVDSRDDNPPKNRYPEGRFAFIEGDGLWHVGQFLVDPGGFPCSDAYVRPPLFFSGSEEELIGHLTQEGVRIITHFAIDIFENGEKVGEGKALWLENN